MRTYADDQERIIRVKRLADEWTRSGLIDRAQHERLAAGLHVDLRRTNRFLRLALFVFGLLIIGAAVGLVIVTLKIGDQLTLGTLYIVAAALCAALAEFLIGGFRLYRFGVEEACAAAAAGLVAAGSSMIVVNSLSPAPGNRAALIALLGGSFAAFAVYRRFGYLYAAVAAMLFASLAPFQLDLSEVGQRLLTAAVLGGCFLVARMKRRRYGDEFPGDEYGSIQATAWLGMYAALNLHLNPALVMRPPAAFYWLTYVATWILPAAGLWLSIRGRDRPLLDASLVMTVATLLTSKPYLGLARKPWDPIVLGLLVIGAALALRRWLAGGPHESRDGITATRLLRSDKDLLAAVSIASGAFQQAPPHAHTDPLSPDPFEGGGGRSGGGGAGAAF